METETQKNKRIAKNTLLLYVRMAFSMVVSLYTSRVVLNALGVEDYGTYGVVGGLVTFFNVISGSLNAAISRFITVELGKRDVRRLNEVFCTSVNIQLLMSVLLVVLVEVAGVWFLHEKMSIPDGRMDAAYWVLQLSILSFVVSLLGVPYNATIIAHEHMGAYAYLSLLSTFLNLGVALVISWVSFDKLIFYAGAIVAIQLVMQLIYVAYCRFHFEETKLRLLFYRSMMKEMTGFAGWNFLGASSGVMMGQGINLLINLFFGVVVNAARGIAGTVDNALNMLVNHFTMALSPQIMKSYAAGDMKYMHQLICKGAKYSFFIMFVPALPILLETRQVLVLWLKQVPDEAVVFTRLAMMISLVSVLSQTLITSMLATGKIRKYQIVISSLSYAVFGLAFVAFYMGYPAYVCYLIQLVIFIIELGVRLYLLRGMISLPVMTFVREVLMKIVWVVMASVAIPLSLLLVLDESYVRLAALVPVSAICALLFVYFAGLSSEERMWVHQQARGAVEKLTIDNLMKEKVITLLRIIFGKKPVVVQQKVETVQLGPTDLLSGKTAVITGGSSGIGLEIAKAMLKAGASVVITGREQQKLDSAVELLKAAKQQHQLVVGVRADAMQVATFDAVFQNIVHAIGDRQVDILVNNAGTRGDCHSDFGTADVHDYDVIMDTNLKGAFFFSQVVARYMKENKIQGNILNIASSSSLRPANSAYTLSKWGVRGLTLGMAKTLIPHGIVVNAIAPGPTATPMMNRDNDDVAFPHNPSGRMATAEEIANMAVVLTSGMGRMAVGNILYMTGGSGLITLDDADYEF